MRAAAASCREAALTICCRRRLRPGRRRVFATPHFAAILPRFMSYDFEPSRVYAGAD